MVKRLSKLIALTLSSVIIIGSLTGCSSSKDTNSDNVKDVETITVWTNSGHTKELMTELVADYNETIGKEKGIKIEYTVHGGDYTNTLDMAITSGQAPDIFKYESPMYIGVQKNAIMPIEDLPGGKELVKKYEGYLDSPSFTYKDKTYSLPYSVITTKLVYNKDMFKKAGIVDENGEAKPPKTWDEVAEYAKKLTNPEDKEYGIALPLKWGGYDQWEMLFVWSASIGREEFDPVTGTYDYKAFKPMYEWMMRIKEDESYFPGAESLDNDPARAQFSEGRVGMKIAASWDVGVFNDQFPAKCDWGVADIPVLDQNNRYKEFMYAANWASISTTAKEKDLEKVMEVYKWFHSDEVMVKMYEEGKSLPFKEDYIKMAKKVPSAKGWEDFGRVGNSYIGGIKPTLTVEGDNHLAIVNKIWSGVVTIDAAVEDLNNRYNAALDKAVEKGEIDMEMYLDPNFDISIK